MPKMEEKTALVPLQRNLILINAEGLKITGLRMILWVFDGEKWIPRKLSPTESQQRNGIKQLENQQNPCLLDVYIYSLICLYRTFSVPPSLYSILDYIRNLTLY